MTTIQDVATKAHVSVATVSRVLNGDKNVREQNVQAVQDAIRELKYRPNTVARSLRKSESRAILVFIPHLANPFYSKIVSGICDTAMDLDYSTYICSVDNTPKLEENIIDAIQNRKADGMIFLSCNHDDVWLKKYHGTFPMVFCAEHVENLDFPFVGIDNCMAAYEAVNYLISLGHRKIGMISSQNVFVSTKLRFHGYCKALDAANIYFRRDYIAYADTDYTFASGTMAAKELLSLPDRPTALFCIADQLALGARAAAEELGLAVPDDLTIWGFDDIEAAQMFHPYLSTVSQPCYEMGCESMKKLSHCMLSSAYIQPSVTLPHELIIRESSAPFK